MKAFQRRNTYSRDDLVGVFPISMMTRTERRGGEQVPSEAVQECGLYHQTVSGFYLAVGGGETKISTRISDPKTTSSIGYNPVFELIPILR